MTTELYADGNTGTAAANDRAARPGSRSHILYAAEASWASQDAASQLNWASFRELKRTRRACAGFLEINGRRCFVKRVSEGHFVKGLIARIRGSRAARILRGAEMLAAAGFAHPRPLLAAEERTWGAVRTSWVASEALPDAHVLSFFMLGDGRNFYRRQWLTRLAAREIRRLHDAGFYTLDMQETNLMLEAAGGELRVYFLDLEDFRAAWRVSWSRRLRNLVHLDRSIGRFASRSRRLRFLYSYLGSKPPRTEVRAVVRRLLQEKQRLDRRSGNGLDPAARQLGHEPIRPMQAATGKLQWRSRY
ncbi:MAG TPA: lipopolysaccharide kinase InaA family protein [Candidatus Binataceae bacterium]|nr:lipopolysaccharide kinase InaA family protein [Candidatus Binataceae bacterium]